MKISFLILFCFFLIVQSFAQNASFNLVSNAGNYNSGANGSLCWSLGESMVESFSNTNNVLTQGFHQTSFAITAIESSETQYLKITVYPNPTTTGIYIDINDNDFSLFSIELYDLKARKIFEKKMIQKNEMIDFSNFSSGTYFVKILNKKSKFSKTIKIEKINN